MADRGGVVARRSRRFCFTINNPGSKLFENGLPSGVRYAVWQLEKGESGTPHYQGYLELESQRRTSVVEGILGGHAAIFFANGTAEQNKAYCTKPDDRISGPWELGECSTFSGRKDKSELERIIRQVGADGHTRSVSDDTYFHHGKGLEAVASRKSGPYRPDIFLLTLVGPTRVGKSYAVRTRYPDAYVPVYGNCGVWFDGYRGEEVILLDEFKGQIPLQRLLALLDPYPLRVDTKHGTVAARWKMVLIVSNSHPKDWYEDEKGKRTGEIDALRARLDCMEGITGDRFIGLDGFPATAEGRMAARSDLARRLDAVLARAPVKPMVDGLERMQAMNVEETVTDAASSSDHPVPPRGPTPAPAAGPGSPGFYDMEDGDSSSSGCAWSPFSVASGMFDSLGSWTSSQGGSMDHDTLPY